MVSNPKNSLALRPHAGETPASQSGAMLKQAVAHYHELLEDSDLAESSFRVLHDGLEHNKLIFGGRPLSPYLRPHFVTETDWQHATSACETVWSALQKV